VPKTSIFIDPMSLKPAVHVLARCARAFSAKWIRFAVKKCGTAKRADSITREAALARNSLNLLLFDDALHHLTIALDAVQGHPTRGGWEETEDPEWPAREVADGPARHDNLADPELVLWHETPPKEP